MPIVLSPNSDPQKKTEVLIYYLQRDYFLYTLNKL